MSSRSETYVNSDDGSISEEFHKHFWKYAIGGIIVMLLGLMAYKIISVLVNNPVTKAVNELVGDFGLLLKDFTKGCCSQDDCPNISTKDECESGCGCGWDDKGSKCANTTDAKVGSGGLISFDCPLFFTAIVGLGAWILVKFGGFIRGIFKDRAAKKGLDALAQTTGEKTGDIMRRWREKVDISNERWREGRGEGYSKAEADYAAKRISLTHLNQELERLKNTNKDEWIRQTQNAKEDNAKAVQAAKDAGVDTGKIDGEVDALAGKDPVPYG